MSNVSHRKLGSAGLRVSTVGLGTNNFGRRLDEQASVKVVHAALDAGITLIDTADSYGAGDSERFIGVALRGRRDQAIVATKFASPTSEGPNDRGGSRAHVIAALEASLRRLETDYIDLYQMHFPDASTPIEETLGALDDAVHAGKIRYLGSSNFSGWQIADADWSARVNGLNRFVSAQNGYSLLSRDVEREVIPACLRFGQGMIPYSPLAGGMLTGKYHRGQPGPAGARLSEGPFAARILTDRNFDALGALEAFAQERDVDLLSVAIGGLAAQPAVVSVIAGATSPEQVHGNVEAGEWEPTAEEREVLDRIAPTRRPPTA
jgi:aryl-alcohol dehydrogenase-like predicted oxidoreductase